MPVHKLRVGETIEIGGKSVKVLKCVTVSQGETMAPKAKKGDPDVVIPAWNGQQVVLEVEADVEEQVVLDVEADVEA